MVTITLGAVGNSSTLTRWVVLFVLVLLASQIVLLFYIFSPSSGFGLEGDVDGHTVLLRRAARLYEKQIAKADNDEHHAQDHSSEVYTTRNKLTIFSILKELVSPSMSSPSSFQANNFSGWVDLRTTRNAILSWVDIPVDLILFGDQNTCQYIKNVMLDSIPEERALHVHCEPPPCVNKEYGAPTYDCIFARAKQLSTTPWLMYSNSDMIYFSEIVEVTNEISKRFPSFVIVGKRVDIRLPLGLTFNNTSWATDLRAMAQTHGTLHGRYGIDYFIFDRSCFPNMLPFLVGRVRWDNWLLAQYVRRPDVISIDASEAITALHQSHGRAGASAKRFGSPYNINLTLGDVIDPKKIGDIEQTDLRIVSSRKTLSPSASYALLEDPDFKLSSPIQVGSGPCVGGHCSLRQTIPSMEAVLYQQHRNRLVIVASVGRDEIDLAINWACNLDRVKMPYYILHASDREVLRQLRLRGLPALMYTSGYGQPFANGKYPFTFNSTYVWSTASYEAQLNGRIELVSHMIMSGFDVLLTDLDVIFLGNPIPLMDLSSHVVARSRFGNAKEISAGFMLIRSSEETKQYIYRVKGKHDRLFDPILKALSDGKPLPQFSSLHDKAFNQALQKDTLLHVSFISSKVVSDHMIFQRPGELFAGEWPLVLYHDDILSMPERVSHLKASGLWLLSDLRACKPSAFPQLTLPPNAETIDGILSHGLILNLLVRVPLTQTKASLSTLLNDIARAEYITNQLPTKMSSSKGAAIWWAKVNVLVNIPSTHTEIAAIKAAVLQFRKTWNYGSVDIMQYDPDAPRTEYTWAVQWLPINQRELALFLEPSLVVTSKFATALLLIAAEYQFDINESEYDPRVFGISLLSQTEDVPFYKASAFKRVNSTVLYRYQKMTRVGTAVFAQHFSEFLVWYFHTALAQTNFAPYIAELPLGKLSEITSWFDRFIAERGFYALYAGSPFGPLVHRPKTSPVQTKHLLNLDQVQRGFMPLNDLIFLDIHSNRVLPHQSLEGRALFYDTHSKAQHRSDLEDEVTSTRPPPRRALDIS